MRPTSRPAKGQTVPPHSAAASKRAAISAEERISELEEALAHAKRERAADDERIQESLQRAVRMAERLQLAEGAAKRVQVRALAAEEEVVVQSRRIKRLEAENAVLRGAGAIKPRTVDESVLEKLMEMRTTLMATASALDDLTHREADLSDVRARIINEARQILLATAGMTYDAKLPGPPTSKK